MSVNLSAVGANKNLSFKIIYENICSTRTKICQFGEGVSVHLRKMDFTFAIGEMRRLMCIPAMYNFEIDLLKLLMGSADLFPL